MQPIQQYFGIFHEISKIQRQQGDNKTTPIDEFLFAGKYFFVYFLPERIGTDQLHPDLLVEPAAACLLKKCLSRYFKGRTFSPKFQVIPAFLTETLNS